MPSTFKSTVCDAVPNLLLPAAVILFPAEAFDFATYMGSTAKQVNAALDAAVPAKYPETLNDAMRCAVCRKDHTRAVGSSNGYQHMPTARRFAGGRAGWQHHCLLGSWPTAGACCECAGDITAARCSGA